MTDALIRFDELWDSLFEIGRDRQTGGYHRLPWTTAELACRQWLKIQARRRRLTVETDGNGNMWAWWGDREAAGAIASGSHLDSVPDGGAYDGALGVVCAFAAFDQLRESGFSPRRPLAVVAFSDEEGARFGTACVGSRLLTGAIDPEQARNLRDADGMTLEQSMRQAELDPDNIGPDRARLARIGAFVEVHIEQGRHLVHLDAPIGVASGIWPHGRFRFDLEGKANHAGTTPLDDRRDPILRFARAALIARESAAARGGFATFGRLQVEPNITNTIPSLVRAWLDARGPDEASVWGIVEDVAGVAGVDATTESWTPTIEFDPHLHDRLVEMLDAPSVPTAAGHDAAILAAAGVSAAMLFVRNSTGISHAPNEVVDRADCLAAVDSLAMVLAELADE